jgi:hypothetical protein
MLDPEDFSCAATGAIPECDRCRAGQACRRCTPEAMEKAERRERLRSIPGSEPTVFDHACWARATKDGRTQSFSDVLKRIWTMTEPVGTYERCQTFREIHHLEDRIERLRGTKPQSDDSLAFSLGIELGSIYASLYYESPFMELIPKDDSFHEKIANLARAKGYAT